MRTIRILATSITLCSCSLALLSSTAWALDDARKLLERSIAHHDPEGQWASGAFRFEFEESRPDGSVRETLVTVDNRTGGFEYATTRDGAAIGGILTPESCTLTLNASEEISDEDREQHRLTCDRLEWLRNYYAYLWGLPMKLEDAGTLLDPEVRRTTFEGRDVLAIKVTYEEPVGGDTWYFYLDPETTALVGYRFYHDESANDGEYIVLEGVAVEDHADGAGMRLPKTRAWYVNADDELLGTDTLVRLESVE